MILNSTYPNMHVLIGSTYILHSSETCQYNSNVLTLVDVTCYVAGLFDISEVDWLGLQVYNQHVCLWHFEDEGPHAIVIFCCIVMR